MNSRAKTLSVIIPARNEAAQIAPTVTAILAAVAHTEGCALDDLHLDQSRAEVLVVDNLSTDGTAQAALGAGARQGVRVVGCARLKAACARNDGAREARGGVLVFVDADTRIPREALTRVLRHVYDGGYGAGIFAYGPLEPGWRAWTWWQFWNHVRLLPLARAKAMPAFMFCTRRVFDRYGPFDEEVVLGEEWPILARLYRDDPKRLIYDRRTVARSSSRRMDLQLFGYLRTYAKYLWAILHRSGRIRYSDRIRQRPEANP